MTSVLSAQELDSLSHQAIQAQTNGDLVTAEQKYRELLASQPDNELAIANLMAALANQTRYAEALPLCRRLRALTPGARTALDTLSYLVMQLGDAAEPQDILDAVAGYEAILAADGADDGARTSLTSLVVRFFGKCRDRYRPAMISTCGRSGTYFTMHFFEFLERRLKAYSKDYDPVGGAPFRTIMAFPNLRLLKVTLHGDCPGFAADYDGPYRAACEALAAQEPPEKLLPVLAEHFDPRLNPDARLVFLYRDPFETMVSGYRQEIRMGLRPDSPASLQEAIDKQAALFALQYFSFRVMKEKYPESIMLLRFEDLITDPPAVFRRLLDFFGVEPPSPDLIRSAARSSSVEQLIKQENRTGRPSGPAGATTHFDRDREARKQVVLSAEDRARVAAPFEALGISLAELAG